MAEYIEKDQALMQLTGRFPKDMSIEKYIGLVNFRINELDTADVIERSEYIELLKENDRLKGDLEFKSEALDSIGQIHQEYVSKIDKAIEEMSELASHKVKPISFDQEVAINMCINILKKNIGE